MAHFTPAWTSAPYASKARADASDATPAEGSPSWDSAVVTTLGPSVRRCWCWRADLTWELRLSVVPDAAQQVAITAGHTAWVVGA